MRQIRTRIHNIATNLNTYLSLAFFLANSGIFTLLGTQWEALAKQGWAAVILVSLSLAAISTIAITMAYWAFSHLLQRRGPVPNAGDHVTGQEHNPSESLVSANLGAALDAALDFSGGLYVGNINVSDNDLADELYVEISIRGFNATGETIRVERARGNLTAVRKENGRQVEDFGDLPTPRVANERVLDVGILNLTEIIVVLEQRVPRQLAESIRNLDDNSSIQFECARLDVIAESEDTESRSARLPLWDGVTLTRTMHRLFVGRLVTISARLAAGPAQIRV